MSIRVLLADDHAVVRAGIRIFLEQNPEIIVVAEASDGAEAQTILKTMALDVAVLDLQMPILTGIELIQWIRAENIEISILLLTAYTDDPYIIAAMEAGANGYILKTASPTEITTAVLDIANGITSVTPYVTDVLVRHITEQKNKKETTRKHILSPREFEVLTLTSKGLTNKEIGVHLNISPRTVQVHLANIFTKLEVGSRTEAVMHAVHSGWIETD